MFHGSSVKHETTHLKTGCLSSGRGQNLVHANEKCLFDKVWRNIMDQNTLHIGV